MNPQVLVYGLCVATSALCAALLARAYLRSRTRLLLWTATCFVFFAINNLLLVADALLFPDIDLSPWRQAAAGLGLASLLYGFIWEAR